MYSQNVYVAILLAYVCFGALIVVWLRGIKGVMAALIIGWMFLPPTVGGNWSGLPQFGKSAAVAYAVIIGMLFVESKAIGAFRPKLIDLPITIWLLVPFVSSVNNGLGVPDGFSEVYLRLVNWGVPYFAGRVLVRTPGDMRTAAIAMMCAGLLAVPFALWEIRMSPQLHRTFYGFTVAKLHMAHRMGGYRPMLFMRHGLEVGLWMATASAAGLWLMIAGRHQIRLVGQRVAGFAIVLFATTVMCRSLGSLILLAGVTAAALVVRSTGYRFVFIALLLTPSVYLSVRLTDTLPADQLTSIVSGINPDRAESFASRLNQEQRIRDHALVRPLFGWGGSNRYRPTNDNDQSSAVDGLTMITLGKNGLVGLFALLAMNMIPSLIIVLKLHGKEMAKPFWAPTIAILLGVTIFSLDMLFNAFPSPVHILALGILAAMSTQMDSWKAKIKASRSAQRTNQSHPSPQSQ